jgi:sulfonate transport system permease protein
MTTTEVSTGVPIPVPPTDTPPGARASATVRPAVPPADADPTDGVPADARAADGAGGPTTPTPTAGQARRTVTPVLTDARSIGRHRRASRIPRPLRRLAGPVLLVALWQLLCSTGVLSGRVMSPPGDVLQAGLDLVETGELQHHLLTSLRRVVIGLSIGVSTGVLLATISGLFRLGEDLLDSTVQVLRAVPTLGLIPLVIIWFGIGEQPKILLVAIGTAFPVYINTHAAIRGVDNKLVEAGTTFGLSRWGLVRRVILPGAVPGFLVGLRFALTGAWLIMIVAEQINARSGLGFLINEARSWYRTDIIVMGLVVYGLLGLVADSIVRFLERTLLAWRRGFVGT